MGWTTFTIVVVVGMVATGTLNTISAGYQQRSDGKGRDYIKDKEYREGEVVKFDHPYLQAMGMMFGECLCMAAYFVMTRIFKKGIPTAEANERNKDFSPLILFPAALFDLLGTCMNYVGMILSYPSSFQMLRGSVIIFTAAISFVFLKRKPKPYQYLAMIVIIGGLCIVGAGDLLFKEERVTCPDTNSTTTMMISTTEGVTSSSTLAPEPPCKESKIGSNPLLGDVIIVVGEIFHAFQFVYEEYYLSKYDLPPLQVVGYEGIFGFTTIGILLWPMFFIPTGEVFGLGPEFRFEDAIDGFTQIANGNAILGWTIANMFSIACFNFAGVTVTKVLDGTTRAVLDNIRQIFIWAFSLAVGWQSFNFMTPIGFVVLISGIWLYNDVIIRPLFYKIIGRPMPTYGKTGQKDPEASEEKHPKAVEDSGSDNRGLDEN